MILMNSGHVARAKSRDNTRRGQALFTVKSLMGSLAKSSRLFSKRDLATVCETDNQTPIMDEPRARGHLHVKGVPKCGGKPRVAQSEIGNSEDVEDFAAMASATRTFKEFKAMN
jgi:hypothetical protein